MNNINLFKYDSKGKVRVWNAKSSLALNENGWIIIEITHGIFEGKIQTKYREVKSGKNIGRSNETTIQEQAELELQYLYTKQLEDGYVTDINTFKELLRPTKATKYKDRRKFIKWLGEAHNKPSELMYESTKLNGIRCFIHIEKGVVTKFESREGKLFKYFHHIADQLKDVVFDTEDKENSSFILDGELFKKGISFEGISPLVNSDNYIETVDPETLKPIKTEDIEFHCYDVADLNQKELTFYERFVSHFSKKEFGNKIVIVPSTPCYSEQDLFEKFDQYIAESYEGVMLRKGDIPYEFNKRSPNLIKYKVMNQDEFLITNIYLAENDNTKVMFSLKNQFNDQEDYSSFDCGLKGNKETNLMYFSNKNDYINKAWLTVDYQVLSSYQVPLFPVGIIIREGTIDREGNFIPTI